MTRPITHALPGGVMAVPPHRLVIAELEADRARILHRFEGVNAAQDYLDRHARPLPRSSP